MSNERKVLVYGASGYTGKIISECLAQRNIPFYMAGRTRSRLEEALKIVEERHGAAVDAEIVTASNQPEELRPLFDKVDVVINVSGPFMQLGWPIVETALECNCHYLDTTGEQDWSLAIKEKYGAAFEEKGLLLNPANSYMWAAGALAAEVVLETEGVDSLDIVYQIDHGLPSEASTKSFLRMVCNDTSQYYLELNELKSWPVDQKYMVAVPHRNRTLSALPWGGANEPIWYMDDPRVRNCSVLVAMGEQLIDGVMLAIQAFMEQAAHLPQEEREAWTNAMGSEMDTGEPPKDTMDVQRSVIVCRGQGQQVTTEFVMNLSAPYTWTGEVSAEAAERLLNGQLKKPGYQSAAQAFGHRELLETFHKLGYCNLPEKGAISMKMNAYVAGVGMTRFGKHLDMTLKGLAGEAIREALTDAGIDNSAIEVAYMGNAAGGVVQGQEMISGQVALRELGIGKIPVINVENACATSSTAFNQACAMVTAGAYDVALVCGFEKLFHEDKMRSFAAFDGAVDTENTEGVMGALQTLAAKAGEEVDEINAGKTRSVFMDIYSLMTLAHMKQYGTTREQIAGVTAKNSFHGSLNPRAQFQVAMSVEEVLAAREIVYPLTLPMCSPIGDGAAAVVVVSERKAKELGLSKPVRVLSSALVSGYDEQAGDLSVGAYAANLAYETAGVGPGDLSLIELHDASAPSEIIAYEYLGICDKGQGGKLIEDGTTRLGGRLPVNVSGGLLRKGHPIGASGAAQIVELTEQLQGRGHQRQVQDARIGLAHNGGGMIGTDAAATVVSILRGES